MAWTYKDYAEGEEVKRRRQALESLQAPSAYQSAYGEKLNGVIGQIENRKPFTYDLNGDALYNQYKDQYVNAGRLAMQDTMGQAAALTGGYGNSYASTAGNQAYQAYLGRLNDVVPQLYQMAYDRYNQAGNDLKDLYGLYSDRENTDYGRYRDLVSDYQTDRNYLAGRYDAERNWDYGMYTDARDRSLEEYKLALAEAQAAASGGGSGRSSSGRSGGSSYKKAKNNKNDVEQQIADAAVSYYNSNPASIKVDSRSTSAYISNYLDSLGLTGENRVDGQRTFLKHLLAAGATYSRH